MNSRAEHRSTQRALSSPELEQRIAATELRMARRRQSLQRAWHELEHEMQQALSPRRWLRPMVLGLLGGSLLGLVWHGLWARRRPDAGPRGDGASGGHEQRRARSRRLSWSRPLLALALQHWLKPLLLRALERALPTLLGGRADPGQPPATRPTHRQP